MKNLPIDVVDRQILTLIQDNAECSAESIAAEVNLSPSAVQRRVARLKKARVIERIEAVVDPRKIGLSVTVLAKVRCASNRPICQEPFRRWVRAEKAVQGCWHIAGEFDYLMVIVVSDLDDYNELSQSMMMSDLGLERIESIVVFQTVKRGLAVNLEPGPHRRGRSAVLA